MCAEHKGSCVGCHKYNRLGGQGRYFSWLVLEGLGLQWDVAKYTHRHCKAGNKPWPEAGKPRVGFCFPTSYNVLFPTQLLAKMGTGASQCSNCCPSRWGFCGRQLWMLSWYRADEFFQVGFLDKKCFVLFFKKKGFKGVWGFLADLLDLKHVWQQKLLYLGQL